MPRAPRGRHRGQHRRPKTHHLPITVGSLAVAAAATGALTVGGQGALASATGAAPQLAPKAEPLAAKAPELDPAALEEALALRSEETVERSTQRDRLGETVAEVEAQKADQERASLDASVGSKLSRFAEAAPVYVLPVEGYTLTSLYGPRWGRLHGGLDMAAPSGTPIYAITDGEIISAKYESGYGNKIILRHEDGTETWYCHQSAFEITSGEVKAGELIGYVGSTGNSTGPHLHLEVHPAGGSPVNPLTWMRELGLPI